MSSSKCCRINDRLGVIILTPVFKLHISKIYFIFHRGLCMSKCRSPPFFVQKIGFEILDKKEDFTNDR
jgi:hypothetical protein